MTGTLLAMLLVGGGLALVVIGTLSRTYEREEELSKILDLPYGEADVDLVEISQNHPNLVESTIGMAGRVIEQLDDGGSLQDALERARIPLRPGEYALTVFGFGVLAASIGAAATENFIVGLGILISLPLVGKLIINYRISKRRKAFEAQFPDALTLIASSLSAGHTFLRAIQLMVEEAEDPLAEEFGRVVNETQLGDPVVSALDRLAKRLEMRDVEWVVQAIRIQQEVGGKLADLLHTLADFIRAREELRREVDVLTAEGKVSAYVLAGLPIFLFFAIQVINPGYMEPMFQGWGWIWLGIALAMIFGGLGIILRMVKTVVE